MLPVPNIGAACAACSSSAAKSNWKGQLVDPATCGVFGNAWWHWSSYAQKFPDPARRPYGDKTLLRGIESPLMGGSDVERITDKIRRRNWTEYDLARIEGRPEPPSKL
jgi:hypothetical protein